MNWNNFLISAVIWLLNITRGLAAIAFVVMIYLIYIEGATPSVNLPLGHGYDFLQNESSMELPEELVSSFENISVLSKGYMLQIGVKGKLVIVYVLVMAISLTIYILFATVLYRLVKSSQEMNFFDSRNVYRLRLIGFSLISLDVLFRVIRFSMRSFFDRWLDPGGVHTGTDVNFVPDIFNNWMFIGLLVLILAQAFHHGLKLKEEQELTI